MSAKPVLELLKKKYGTLKHYLNFSNPLELLVGAILSPQVRDEIVNAATPSMFKEYKTAKDYASATVKDLLKHISKISFAGKKAEHIIAACKILDEKFGGKVPRTLDELTQLPGIGKKTAIVILAHAYDIVEGIAVDTHVLRVSYRLGWTKNTNADKVEKDLRQLIPKEWWKQTPLLLKAHGRETCKAAVPYCSKCMVTVLCPKNGVTENL